MSESTSENGNKLVRKLTEEEVKARGPFTSKEEADAHKAVAEARKWKLHCVTADDGTSFYSWARHEDTALLFVAKEKKGWTSVEVEKVDKSKVAAGLAALSEEERAALLESMGYAPAKGKGKGGKGLFKPEGPYGDNK
jgi:hypothetical protein